MYLVSCAASPTAHAEESPQQDVSPKRFFFGDCSLKTDPADPGFSSGLQACVESSVGILAHTDSDYQQNSWDYFGTFYSGLHWSELLSTHFRGAAAATQTTTKKTKTLRPISDIDELSLRIGNRAIHQATGIIGYQDLPFGLNLKPSADVQAPDPQRTFWQTEKMAAVGSWQDDFDLRVDFGVSTRPGNLGTRDAREHEGAALRVTKAISALDGTQFLASAYAKGQGLRRVGMAMLNSSRRGEQTGLEWVREISLHTTEPFRQIIRISYAGVRKQNRKWNFLYDHVVRDHRAGELGHSIAFKGGLEILLALKYTASDIDTSPSHWTFTTGIAASL
jgi:hypothetical protein